MKKIKFLYPLIIVLIVLGISVNSLLYKEFFRVHDFTQGARVAEMFRGFQDGQIPVRWSQNFGYGYGMPTFHFYAPLPYIVGAFFYWISNSLIFSLRVIWAIPSLLSFIGMFLLTKKYYGRWGALVAATAFTLAPYRAVDLYVRGAIGEIWGIAFFPWILWSVDQWFIDKKKIDTRFILTLIGLFLSHNLMTLFFFPVILCYVGLKWLNQHKKRLNDLWWANAQIGVAIACSSFYLFPAFLEKNLTKFDEKILGGYFHYSLHFLYLRQFFQENWKYGGSTWGPEDDISFFLGYGQLVALVVFLMSLSWYVFKIFRKNSFSIKRTIQKFPFLYHPAFPLLSLSLIFFPISIYLSVQRSQVVWDLISVLQTAQFPWRFLSLVIFFVATIVGAIGRFQFPTIFKNSLIFLILILLILPALKYFQPEKFIENSPTFYYSDSHRIRFEMSQTWIDFLPLSFNEKLPPTDERFVSQEKEKVEVLISRSHQLLLKTQFTQSMPITINIGAFPGWKAYIQGVPVSYQTSKDGLIELTVPAGDQLVSINLERTVVRVIADVVSVFGLCIVLFSQINIRKNYVTQLNR